LKRDPLTIESSAFASGAGILPLTAAIDVNGLLNQGVDKYLHLVWCPFSKAWLVRQPGQGNANRNQANFKRSRKIRDRHPLAPRALSQVINPEAPGSSGNPAFPFSRLPASPASS
jgi:hypothetical protein